MQTRYRLIPFTLLAALLLVRCTGIQTTPEIHIPEIPSDTPLPTLTWTPIAPTPTAGVFDPRATSTPIPTNTPLPELSDLGGLWPMTLPPDYNPLTGLQMSDPRVLDRRPMVIKITNFPRSVRPQWGLTIADHVYEYYLEDGLTRFIGVFYGRDGKRVGPIRSARPFDEHVVRMYKGVFVFGYADDRVMDPLLESDLKNLLVFERPNNCPPLCRIGPKNAYNTLYADTQELTQYITDRGVDNTRQVLGGFRFDENTVDIFGGGKADRVNVRFSRTSHHYWEYDPNSQRYLRWQEAENRDIGEEVYEPLFDSLTDQQVAADNLVILQVPIGYFYKSNSTEIYDIALKGQGSGYVLRNGKIFGVRWIRYRQGDLVSIAYPNGISFPFKPGNIWFIILSEVSLYQVEGQTWSFFFDLDLP